MRKRVVIILIILVVLVIVSMVVKNIIKIRESKIIELTGSVETTEVDASFQVPGKIKRLLVDEGDRVKTGQLLAVLDSKDLLSQKASAQAVLESAQSQLPQLETRIQLSREQNSGKVWLAKGALNESTARLNELHNGYRTQEVEQAAKEVDAASSSLKLAKKDYNRAESLYREDAMSGQQRDAAKTNYQVTLARYKQAAAQFNMLQEGNRTEDIEMGASKVDQAQANLKLAQVLHLETENLLKQKQTLEAQVKQAKANLSFADIQLQHTRLYAPINGVVLVKPKEIGEVVSPGSPVITLGNIEKLWLKAYINETDIGKVKLGQKVAVTTDSFPGKKYQGKIYFISSEAEFTPKNLQTKEDRVKLVYRIKVSLDNPNQELKPGMIADGTVNLENK